MIFDFISKIILSIFLLLSLLFVMCGLGLGIYGIWDIIPLYLKFFFSGIYISICILYLIMIKDIYEWNI